MNTISMARPGALQQADPIWRAIRDEALEAVNRDPLLAAFLYATVLNQESLEEAVIHWSLDNWMTAADSRTIATGIGMHYCDLPIIYPTHDGIIRFTIFWPKQNRWEGTDFTVAIG